MTVQVCRTCLSTSNLQSIDNSTVTSIEEMLMDVCSIQMSKNTSICRACTKKLHDAFEFKRQAASATEMFTNFIIEVLNGKIIATPRKSTNFDEIKHEEDDLLRDEPVKTENDDDVEFKFDVKRFISTIEYEERDEPSIVEKRRRLKNLKRNKRIKGNADGSVRPFRCTICGKSYDSEPECKRHVNTHKMYPCTLCARIYRTRKVMEHHVKYQHTHATPSHFCETCGKGYSLLNSLKRHVRTIHENVRFACDKCDKTYASQDCLDLHTRVHTIGTSAGLKCHVCCEVYANEICLRVHEKRHGQPMYTCDECEKEFREFAHLETHVTRTHYDEVFAAKGGFMYVTDDAHKSILCQQCEKTFDVKDQKAYVRHTLIHKRGGARIYSCDICNKEFVSMRNVRLHTSLRHVKTGTKFDKDESKPNDLTCTKCHKLFNDTKQYEKHLERHVVVGDQFSCKTCNLEFITQRMLDTHESRKHVATPVDGSDPVASNKRLRRMESYLCPDCGRTFHNKYQFREHVNAHANIRPLSCKYCPRKFTYTSGLYTHMKSHSSKRDYECQICNRTFVQLGHLKTHMSTHTGAKPYKCPYCAKAFALNGNLTVHKRTHTGETPYLCCVCGKGFNNSSARKKHMAATHKGAGLEEVLVKETVENVQ